MNRFGVDPGMLLREGLSVQKKKSDSDVMMKCHCSGFFVQIKSYSPSDDRHDWRIWQFFWSGFGMTLYSGFSFIDLPACHGAYQL